MSSLNVAKIQIGKSATASNTFTLQTPAVPDGSLRLVRGNLQSDVQDILTVEPTGALTLNQAVFEKRIALAGSQIDVALASMFTKTISGATALTITGMPSAGKTVCFTLDLTNGGSAVITWWSGIKWSAGTPPTLTAAGRDMLLFISHDGGVVWTGLLLGKDLK